MAVRYIVNGNNALKPSQNASFPLDAAFALLNGTAPCGRERTEVDRALDDFAGVRLGKSVSERVFAVAAFTVAVTALFVVSFIGFA